MLEEKENICKSKERKALLTIEGMYERKDVWERRMKNKRKFSWEKKNTEKLNEKNNRKRERRKKDLFRIKIAKKKMKKKEKK